MTKESEEKSKDRMMTQADISHISRISQISASLGNMTQLKQGTVDELVDEFDRYDSFQKNDLNNNPSKQPSEYEQAAK